MNRPERIATPDIEGIMLAMGRQARAAQRELALASTEAKNTALAEAARALRRGSAEVLEANARDLEAAGARGNNPAAMQ